MVTRASNALAAALIAAPLGGCAAHAQHTIPIAVLVDGDRAAIGTLPAQVDGLALRELALPAPPPRPSDDVTATVTRARTAYVRGELDACRRELEGVDVTALLAAGDRALAARALAFDAACAWGAMAKADAQADAARFASFGLELPEAAIAPDVETLIGAAITAVGGEPLHALELTGEVGARLRVDGRPAGCAVPCKLELSPGDHVIAVEADGFAPASQRVRTPDTAHLALAQGPASPALAAEQWRARLGRGLPGSDATGAALIARFGGDRRVAWLHGDARLAGGLVLDGKLVASSDRARGDAAGLVRELAYDGGVLSRPALWQRPWFWIAVTAATAVIAGGIVAETYQPTIINHVGIH